MKKTTCLALSFLGLFCMAPQLQAQHKAVEFGIGSNIVHYFHLIAPGYYYTDNEVTKLGYSAGINLNTQLGHKFPIRLSLKYLAYGKEIQSGSSSISGYTYTKADVMTHALSVDFYPINIRNSTKRLHISLGTMLEVLLFEQATGEYRNARAGSGLSVHPLTKEDRLNSPAKAGLALNAGYAFPLAKDWSLVPQLTYHVSLLGGLTGVPTTTSHPMRFMLELGLRKNLYKPSKYLVPVN